MLHELTGFRRDILYTILGVDEPHGTKINQVLEDRYEKTIYHGRLYDNLDILDEEGLIEKHEVDGRTNSYQITERGRKAIMDHRNWQESLLDEQTDKPVKAD